MPDKETLERAQKDAREGKSPTTQAGEFVREEIHHVREGRHGVRNPKQAIAIGLSKARKAGVKLPPAPGLLLPRKKAESTDPGVAAVRRQKIRRDRTGIETRGPLRGVAPRAFPADESRRAKPVALQPLAGGAQGGTHSSSLSLTNPGLNLAA